MQPPPPPPPPHPHPNSACYLTAVCRDFNLDLAFVIDASGSICDEDPTYNVDTNTCDNWALTLAFVTEAVNQLTIGPEAAQVAVIVFADDCDLQWTLGQ